MNGYLKEDPKHGETILVPDSLSHVTVLGVDVHVMHLRAKESQSDFRLLEFQMERRIPVSNVSSSPTSLKVGQSLVFRSLMHQTDVSSEK